MNPAMRSRQSYRQIIHSDVCHPLTQGAAQERAVERSEVGKMSRQVDAYYAKHPELKQPWKRRRPAV